VVIVGVNKMKNKIYFSVLKKWKISYPKKEEAEYRGQTCFDSSLKDATIYPCDDTVDEKEYLFHEQLHLALEDMIEKVIEESYTGKDTYCEKEEKLIREICSFVDFSKI